MIIGALDLETTGLDEKKDRIIEIALILYDADTRKEVGAFETLVNPGFPIPSIITDLTGITTADVGGSPQFGDVARNYAAALDSVDLLVAHNAQFDIKFTLEELQRAGINLPEKPVLDTADSRWATEDGKIPNLQDLCFATGVSYDAMVAHRARYDTQRMMEAVFGAMDLGFFREVKQMMEASGAELATTT